MAKLIWFEEDLYHFGPVAIPTLQQVLEKDSGGEWHYGRGLSGSTLTRIATYYPDTRDEVAAILRAQLPPLETIPDLRKGNVSCGYTTMRSLFVTERGDGIEARGAGSGVETSQDAN